VRGTGNIRRQWWPRAAATGQTVVVGLPVEADVALAATHTKAKTVGLPVEADTALHATGAKVRAVGFPVEADTALGATHAKAGTVGLPVEADTALGASHARAKTVGLPVETDTALAATTGGHLVVAVGLAVETDTALAATAVLATLPPPVDTGPTGGRYEPGGDESAIYGRSVRIVSRPGLAVAFGSRATVRVESRPPRPLVVLPRRVVSASVVSVGGVAEASGTMARVRLSSSLSSVRGVAMGVGSRSMVLAASAQRSDDDDAVALMLLGAF
jgi:peptidyl-tRNA hydrolase